LTFRVHNHAAAGWRNHQKETLMKSMFVTALSMLLTTGLAWADCNVDADAKKLAGAARTSFLKKCEADAKGPSAASTCQAQADEKKLAGAARGSFMKKCEKDALAAPKSSDAKAKCAAMADDKKLKGAARNSFTKKCEADSK
jgi:hypothetical protein